MGLESIKDGERVTEDAFSKIFFAKSPPRCPLLLL